MLQQLLSRDLCLSMTDMASMLGYVGRVPCRILSHPCSQSGSQAARVPHTLLPAWNHIGCWVHAIPETYCKRIPYIDQILQTCETAGGNIVNSTTSSNHNVVTTRSRNGFQYDNDPNAKGNSPSHEQCGSVRPSSVLQLCTSKRSAPKQNGVDAGYLELLSSATSNKI